MNKFKKRFGLAAVSSLLALAPAVHAATNTFDGNTFAVDYGASDGGTKSFFSLAHADATGSASGVEVANHTPGFETANMSMSWRPVKQTQLSMGIENIFDRTYFEHLSRRTRDVPPGFVNFGRVNEPGRALWFRVVFNM
jgi:outer membrane receptor protein involved in Fe transport